VLLIPAVGLKIDNDVYNRQNISDSWRHKMKIPWRFTRKQTIVAACCLVVVAFFAMRIYGYIVKEPVVSLEEIYRTEGIPVEVADVSRGQMDIWKTFSGELKGILQAELTSDLSTRVVQLLHAVGDQVKKGDIIMKIDPSDPSSMTVNFRQDQELYLKSLRDFERMKILYEAGAVSKQDFENARTAYDIATSDYNASKESVEIPAPFDGTLTDVNVNEGDRITSGMVLGTVAVTDRMRVDLTLSEEKAKMIAKGQPTRIVVNSPSGRDVTVSGMVESVSLSADPVTGLFGVRVTFDNPDGKLTPGTVTRVQILVFSAPDALVIPASALMTEGDSNFVWIVDKKRIASKRMITVGWQGDDAVEIVAGANVGDRVVSKGQNMLTENALVKILNPEK
jgi:RND family efflux transporter MFP subunit